MSYGDGFRGLVWFAVIGMLSIPIVGAFTLYEVVCGIVWLCRHVRFQ